MKGACREIDCNVTQLKSGLVCVNMLLLGDASFIASLAEGY
jgi:hypothetical protein